MNKELVVPIVVVILAIAFLDPFMVLMPITVIYIFLALLLISALLYSLLIWREDATDEREYILRAFAGRMSFITGVGVLVAGIIYQVLIVHKVDPFLVIALALMTLTKYFSHKYAEKHY